MLRQLRTGATIFLSPSFSGKPAELAACEMNVMLVAAIAEPKLPHMGRYITGWGVGIEAFGSPMALQPMNPPFTTISGFTPKKAGFHKTRSASLPASIEPISLEMPCVMAGLIVYFAT